MPTLTAPGAERLPWDPAQCVVQGPHKHSGDEGCRIERVAAAEWNAECARNLSKLVREARRCTRRRSRGRVTVLGYVLERQQRGVFHPHLILGYETAPDREALDIFTGYLKRYRARYGFGRRKAGFKDGQPGRFVGADAGRYVAKYLRPDQAKASFIPLLQDVNRLAPNTETGRRPLVRPVYVSPRLTGQTGVTMTWMRARRWMYRLYPGSTPAELDFLALLRVKFDAWPDAAGPRPVKIERGSPEPMFAREPIPTDWVYEGPVQMVLWSDRRAPRTPEVIERLAAQRQWADLRERLYGGYS
jgi:hypothetical protein